MPVSKVSGFYFNSNPEGKKRRLGQRHADPAKTPWTPMTKPLSECKVALISTAGIYMKGDESFDYERERREFIWETPPTERFRGRRGRMMSNTATCTSTHRF